MPVASVCKLVTLNVQGLQSPGAFERFLNEASRWVIENQGYVFLIQEHNLNPSRQSDLERLAASRDFKLVVSFNNTPDSNGVHWGGTLVLACTKHSSLKSIVHQEAGATVVDLDCRGRTLRIASIYAPARPIQRVDFFNTLNTFLDSSTIAAGDWNCVPDVTLDVQSKNPLGYPNVGYIGLQHHMSQLKLEDTRRVQLGVTREATRVGTNPATATRLDRFYIPLHDDFDDLLTSFEVRSDFVFHKSNHSDHRAVCLNLEEAVTERGHARRTINEELMSEPEVQKECMRLFDSSYNQKGSQIAKFERALRACKNYLLEASAARRKRDHKEIKGLTALLTIAHKFEAHKGPSDNLTAHIKNLQSKVYDLTHPGGDKPMTPRQSLAAAEGSDTCSRRFFKPYKSLAKQQTIPEIKTAVWEDGKEPAFTGTTSSPEEVPKALKSYYEMLYAPKTIDDAEAEKIFKVFRKRAIPRNIRDELELPISEDELLDVLSNLHCGSQAGPDRLPNGFYRNLATFLHKRMCAALNEAIDRGALPKHMLQGDICLLYKKKSRDDPRNYRPITLLNCSYKIYTRILARRLKKVVHLFISESQKGFAPGAFIGECSMLLNLIEAWVNDEPMDRRGLMLFLDMEKAFDRCSYKYLNNSLLALGFGKRFRRSVHMMYNEDSAPKRRIFANGYYSDWFDIKSGVAQGCPASPLLFLIVAEGLRISVDAQGRSLLGIKIGDRHYKISQFADDTTLLLGSIKELKFANLAIKKWCAATGMRENVDKREGLPLGDLRDPYRDPNVNLPSDVKWAPEGDHVISLGVPVGNDLDHAKWWAKKHEAVRARASTWARLHTASYFGRNLIVQSMFLGCLRYWLFSLPMNTQTCTKIQLDADQLWWAKKPSLKDDGRTRFKRFLDKRTAPGPRNKGGIKNMIWQNHVKATQADWIHRYVDPSEAAWKDLWDFLLLQDHNVTRSTRFKFPEGRYALLLPLSRPERVRLLRNVPKRASYLRACIGSHREVGPKYSPKTTAHLGGESLAHNHRFTINAPYLDLRYITSTFEGYVLSDVIDDSTCAPFTKIRLLKWARALHRKYHKQSLSLERANRYANAFMSITDQIPSELMDLLKVPYKRPTVQHHVPYIAIDGDSVVYFKTTPQHPQWDAITLFKDTLGILHTTDDHVDVTTTKVFEVAWWHSRKGQPRARGPLDAVIFQTKGWKLGGKDVSIDSLSISVMTDELSLRKFKPPASELAWRERLETNSISLPFPKIWKIRSCFVTPRDTLTWLKVQHRNLYVGKRNPDPALHGCLFGCRKDENIQHIAECPIIFRDYWRVVLDLMNSFEIEDPDDCTSFILLGRVDDTHTANPVQATFLYLAWRCLYATLVGQRADGRKANLTKTLGRFASMLLSRIEAYGLKWRNWSRKNTYSGKPHIVPLKHRNKVLIERGPDGEYTISSKLTDFHTARQVAIAADRVCSPCTS